MQQFSPPNVGVVGPLHKGGNQVILTYDFVHRTHIDVFGYYYPRIFTDWFADNWMSEIYGAERTLKMPNVKLVHTEEAGQRYSAKAGKQKYLQEQIDEDRLTLDRCVILFLTCGFCGHKHFQFCFENFRQSLWEHKQLER